MIERWNAKVKPGDTVYHLGDVVINKKSLHLVSRLNGRKILIRGNHDIFKDDEYREVGFEQLLGVRVFVDQFILSHIPLHPECVTDRFKVNVHGHLHANEVTRTIDHFEDEELVDYKGSVTDIKRVYAYSEDQIDPRYLCVSVEHTNYEPLHFDEVEARIKKRWEDTCYAPTVRAWGNGSGPG
jgi:calcineurin-like phosphoesterase family protein